MKCPYCGGEVSSTSIACSFCGRENPEGIAFWEEVAQKIERNKLLKPFLIKQKTPALVQKMLTRIWIILILLNAVLLFFSFLVFLWSERDRQRVPEVGSHAEKFLEEFGTSNNWEYENFCDRMLAVMDAAENGEIPKDFEAEYLVEYAYAAVAENTDSASGREYENAEEYIMTVQAFFRGYLGFDEEEMAFLLPDENGEYNFRIEDEIKEAAVRLVREKLEVAEQ